MFSPSNILVVAAMLASVVAILADQPEKRPGNLAPIQLISALGAWSLLVVDGVVASMAIAAGSVAMTVVPAITIVSAAIVFARGSGGERSARSVPDSVGVVIAEIRELLGGARRLGLDQIDAVLASSRGPLIGVTTPARGRVVVRVHESLVAWIDRHLHAGGANAATIGSFIRFAVLHELGHILNGDHRTYRFARAVLISHLWWILSAGVAAFSLASGDVPGARMALAATTFVALLVAAQSLIARRFIAERERWADWRAMQSLSMADASRLLQRSGRLRSGRRNPTEIEKLMIDLKAEPASTRPPSLLSRAIRVVWPEGDGIQQRAEALAGDRAGAPAQPIRWAALAGLQCGVLTTSLAIAVFLMVRPTSDEVALWVLLIAMSWIAGPVCMYCAIRTDPARMSVGSGSRTQTQQRISTGIVFFLAFVAGALATDRFVRLLSATEWISGSQLAVAIVVIAIVVGGCVWLSGMSAGHDGGGELRDTPRAPWVGVAPLLVAMAIVLIPFNIAFASWLGLGGLRQGMWVAVMLCSFGAYILSTGLARSTRPVLRALSPMAMLDTPSPVYGFRVFWREFFVDVSRYSLARAGGLMLAAHTVALLFFVIVIGFAMQSIERVTDSQTAFLAVFFGAFPLFALILLLPDRYQKMRGSGLRLVDRSRLELFGALLEGARHADELVAERIRSTLARWMSEDRLVLVLLPDRRSLWMLSPLLTLVRLARAAGAIEIIERTRGQIESALRDVLNDDDAVSMARSERPSLYYSTLAVAIIDEAGLAARFPFSRMLDRIDSMLAERMASRSVNLVTDIVSAARLLQAHGRAIPEAAAIRRFVQRSTLMSKPLRHQSLVELCELADLFGDTEEKEKLAPIVRSRMWEVLQLNPRKEVLPLLDCYLAAVRLGERESALVSAAAATIAEIAARTADELAAVLSRIQSES